MNRLFTFFIISIFVINSTNAQDNQVKELVSKIKGFTDDQKLNDYLLKERLITKETDETSFYFTVEGVKVDVFKKNLFGDVNNEVVIQVRENGACAVNIFYYKEQKLIKVPGNITFIPYEGAGYGDQSFVFAFENIFKENEFSIVTTHSHEYNRSAGTDIALFRIAKDTIQSFYSFGKNSSTYSGVMVYAYTISSDFSFQLENNQYPKVLVRKVNYSNEDHHYEGSGDYSEGTYTEITSFKDDKFSTKKINEVKYETFLIGKMEDFQNLKKCNPFTTVYISEYFFYTFLQNENEIPAMVDVNVFFEGGKGYKCCNAFVKNRKLFIQSEDSSSKKMITKSFALKPLVTEIIKPEIKASRLYYITPSGNNPGDDGKVTYFNKDTTIKYIYDYIFVRFSDTSSVYFASRDDQGIKLNITTKEGFIVSIPLSKLSPYIKPEFLVKFQNVKE